MPGCRVSLGGIPYWAAWSEGQVVFSVVDSVYGHGSRIVVSKHDPTGLLYVECADNLGGSVPAAHIARAVEMAATVLGPDHFRSLEAKNAYSRSLPWITVTRFGWRSGLVQIRGKPVFRWGEFRRRAQKSLPELAAEQSIRAQQTQE